MSDDKLHIDWTDPKLKEYHPDGSIRPNRFARIDTRRVDFAMAALTGLMTVGYCEDPSLISAKCVKFADALIKELDKEV